MNRIEEWESLGRAMEAIAQAGAIVAKHELLILEARVALLKGGLPPKGRKNLTAMQGRCVMAAEEGLALATRGAKELGKELYKEGFISRQPKLPASGADVLRWVSEFQTLIVERYQERLDDK